MKTVVVTIIDIIYRIKSAFFNKIDFWTIALCWRFPQ